MVSRMGDIHILEIERQHIPMEKNKMPLRQSNIRYRLMQSEAHIHNNELCSKTVTEIWMVHFQLFACISQFHTAIVPE